MQRWLAFGDFSIFLYALSCFDLLAYAACQCMWSLHEANVAVDFSCSLLSLCDIVYWEKKQYKCEIFFLFSKEDTVVRFFAIYHDPHEELVFLFI